MISKEITEILISTTLNENDSLNNISNHFFTHFNHVDQLIILTSLSSLLFESILEPSQKIIIIWLLFKTYEHINIKESPFYYLFVKLAQNTSMSKIPEICSTITMSNSMENYGNKTSLEILEGKTSSNNSNQIELPLNDDNNNISGISSIYSFRSNSNVEHITQNQVICELIKNPVIWTDYEIPFLRQSPDLTSLTQEELQFLPINTDIDLPLIYDLNSSINKRESSKFIIQNSSLIKFNDEQINILIDFIKHDQLFLSNFQFSKIELNNILNINPKIGSLLIGELTKNDISYFDYIIELDLNELIFFLIKYFINNFKLPSNFLQKFIKKNIIKLSNNKDLKDIRQKSQIFSNFIIFLQSNKIEFTSDMILDLHSFFIKLTGKGISEVLILSKLFE